MDVGTALMLALVVAGLLGFALVLRVIPIALSPRGAGIDHWFWKSYVETLRRDRQFPPSLPQYILDEHQWYPPLFPLLLARLPARVFSRQDTLIAIVVDLARMLVLLGVSYWRTRDMSVVAVAGLLYATTPIHVFYNVQLNPRGLAALMLDGLLLLLLLLLDQEGAWFIWPIVVVMSGLILLTHKMTSQLFWFLVLGTALIYRNWSLLLLIPLSMAAAFAMSRGFYREVLRAHWDIVSFWQRNWRWAGADLIRESPVYGDGQYERPRKLHPSGLRGLLHQSIRLIGFNPAAWVACLLVYDRLWIEPVMIFPTIVLVWLLLTCLLVCLTTFVPWFKCLGAGYLYLYNATLITSLLIGLTFKQTLSPQLSLLFTVGVLLCNCFALLVYYVDFHSNKRARVHPGLEEMIERLRQLPRGVVMCIPANWYEVVAYKTGHPVLWGAHGYGFRKVEPTWPRFLVPVSEILRWYGVRYLLTMEGMLTDRFAADLPPARVESVGEYHLYCFETAADLPLSSAR